MFVDIHSHILSNLDDGAANIETSMSMLKMSVQNNVKSIIATPHFIPGTLEQKTDVINKSCKDLNDKASTKGMSIDILPGCEVFITPEIVSLLKDGVIPTLNNSTYVLVEFPLMLIPTFAGDVLYSMQINGFRPILAHPERNSEIIKNPDILYKLVERGILAQINASSITGNFGKEIAKKSLGLIKNKLVHFVASDAHTMNKRSPDLTKAASIVEKKFGKDTVDLLFKTNGSKVIDNKPIETENPVRIKRFFSFLGERDKYPKISI